MMRVEIVPNLIRKYKYKNISHAMFSIKLP
jgi:hypothetical protein